MRRLIHHAFSLLALGLAGIAATGCGASAGPDAARQVLESGPAVCPEGPRRPAATVRERVAETGATANAVRSTGDGLWVVESGANTVSRYRPSSGRYRSNFVDVGNGRNPYSVAVDADSDRMFVTNFLADSVTVVDTHHGEVVRELDADALEDPQGVALAGDHVYVTNVALQSSGDYGAGSVVVFDRDPLDVAGRVESQWKNPQFARRIETPGGPRVAITDSGAIDIDAGRARPASRAGLEIWRPTGRPDPDARRTFPLEGSAQNGAGTPGRPVPLPNDSRLYFPSGTSPVLFAFDLDSGEWTAGADDPIDVYHTDDNALLHAAAGPRGLVYVSAFNRDSLYIVDSHCDRRLAGPLQLGGTRSLLAGAHSIATHPAGEGRSRAYVAMTRSHVLARATFDFDSR